jgi:hypothetical protein
MRPALWLPALQAPATLIFGTLAFIAIAAGSQLGSTLVAVGLLAHTAWDVIHLRAGPSWHRPWPSGARYWIP